MAAFLFYITAPKTLNKEYHSNYEIRDSCVIKKKYIGNGDSIHVQKLLQHLHVAKTGVGNIYSSKHGKFDIFSGGGGESNGCWFMM